jgi:hypothetical protein
MTGLHHALPSYIIISANEDLAPHLAILYFLWEYTLSLHVPWLPLTYQSLPTASTTSRCTNAARIETV